MAQHVTRSLFRKAQKVLVGGVSSPVRAFGAVGGDPVLIKRGYGSRVFDHDGKEYTDYVLSWGSAILGHAHPQVVEDLEKTWADGWSFGTTNRREVELALLIRRAIPSMEKMRFVNSGTEAVMGAVRLARGFTGRDKIVKFEGAYHGHADYLLAKAGSGLATLGMSDSAGVPAGSVKDTIVVPGGDRERLDQVLRTAGRRIAAVIFEPVGGNNGVIPPDFEFMGYLRKATRTYGTLLIADEVITGFRFHFGSITHRTGIEPDLICLGKIVGGGLPVGVYGGRREIMDHLAPLGKVYQASTFSGNPAVMQAGLSTLRVLEHSRGGYEETQRRTARLVQGLREEAGSCGVDLRISHYKSMFSFHFAKRSLFPRLYRRFLAGGIYFAPSEFEANFVSFAHTKSDIDRTLGRAAVSWRGSHGKH